MIPEDMKPIEYVPWDAPAKPLPLADLSAAIEKVREYGVPVDRPEAWPQSRSPVVPWWRRLLARLWPEDRNRPRAWFQRNYYGSNDLELYFCLGRHTQFSCYAFGRGVQFTFEHGRNCDCDDCISY